MENPDNFTWTSKGDWATKLILYILQESCGYSEDKKKFRKSDRIVFMNLVSPRIDWKGYAKAQIDFKPFANLGEIIYGACKGGTKQIGSKRVTQTGILNAYLRRRQKAIQQNPKLVVTDRLTPSDVWYDNRPELIKNGIKISKNTRRNFTQNIRVICEEEFNCNMEELGIFAADRAQLYFDGQWSDIGFDDLHSLKFKGTLFTRGFTTKYVRDLSELSANAGCNVCVLSDYDDSGILLASKLKVPRLGIDPKTLEYFNLKREDVEESYTPKSHLDAIKCLVSNEEYEYLSRKRIEINSVKTKVGTEKFWEWIIYRLDTFFPKRNYNRAIEVPKVVRPKSLNDLYTTLDNSLRRTIKPNYKKEVKELIDFRGFINNVPKRRIDIEKRLEYGVTSNQHYQDFLKRFSELVKSFCEQI